MRVERRLADAFLRFHPASASSLLEQADPAAAATVLGSAPPPVVAAALQQLDPADAAAILSRLPEMSGVHALSALSPGTAAQMLRALASDERERLLGRAPEATARSLRTALALPGESAGSLMDSNVLALHAKLSVGEARRRVRRKSERTGNYLYMIDGERRLIGAVALSKLISASPIGELSSLMTSEVLRLQAGAGVEQILNHPGWRELHALPVVDSDGVLVGIIRRETYEQLRDDRSRAGDTGSAGVGVAMAELVWTAMLSTVDGIGGVIRPEATASPTEVRDEK